jgi:hypothetical protein
MMPRHYMRSCQKNTCGHLYSWSWQIPANRIQGWGHFIRKPMTLWPSGSGVGLLSRWGPRVGSNPTGVDCVAVVAYATPS